ncbi:MAG: GTP pyrophosphokinase family protein [Eubacteriales bacterium]|nr:GTP pyrophosphokinase family protein [Eubacteriales bacterium]
MEEIIGITALREAAISKFERALASRFPSEKAKEWVRQNSLPYRELMTYYHCALMEVETKFKVLDEDFAIRENMNPIESIKTRIKSPESIVEKMIRNEFPLTVKSIEENLNDIAGIRVICSFESDIYKLADALLRQDDVILLREKDYIKRPKENGYRSLHLIIATPIFLHDEKRMMKVEVQLRTLAMDVWASLEHKIRYKKSIEDEAAMETVSEKLQICAQMSAELDRQMQLAKEAATGENIG